MIDPRLRFIVSSDDRQAAGGDGATVFISAGSRLDPEALGWISYGLSQLEEGGLGCDWDWCTHRWDGPVVYTDPQLNGLFDLDRLLSLETPPPLVAFRGQVPGGPLDGEGRRHALAQRSVHAPIVHVPLPLVAIGGIAERAKIAPENGEPMPLWSQPRRAPRRPQTLPLEIVERDGRPALTCGPLKDVSERIRIIIPTRDCVADLAVAIESLIDTAHHPETLTFCLIDNRSVEPETIIYLQGAAARDRFEVLQYDAPFNWSAINNYGAELGMNPFCCSPTMISVCCHRVGTTVCALNCNDAMSGPSARGCSILMAAFSMQALSSIFSKVPRNMMVWVFPWPIPKPIPVLTIPRLSGLLRGRSWACAGPYSRTPGGSIASASSSPTMT
jgi:hypothetical protein